MTETRHTRCFHLKNSIKINYKYNNKETYCENDGKLKLRRDARRAYGVLAKFYFFM